MLVQLSARFVNAGHGSTAELELRTGLERDRVLIAQECDHRAVLGFPHFTPAAFDEVSEDARDTARAVVFERRAGLTVDRELFGLRPDPIRRTWFFRALKELEQVIARAKWALVVGGIHGCPFSKEASPGAGSTECKLASGRSN